jgi:VCBS repeat-containing protein
MKKSLLLLLSAFTILNACKKDEKETPTTTEPYKCTTCITTPEAKEQHNGSSAGVYKGVLVGSTGTIALYLYNTGTEVTALVSFDGKNATLTTTSLGNWAPGQAISNALFTGTIDGQTVQATFSVDANGQNPTVTVTIPGHNVNVAIYKETSTALIRNFEGTYTGGDEGIFNMVIVGDQYSIVSDGGGDPMESTLVNGKVDLNHNGVEVKGEFDGNDHINGTWKDNNNTKEGTWSGNRTL